MRTKARWLQLSTAFCVLGALAACSDGAARLGGGITTASLGISNQDRIIRKIGVNGARPAPIAAEYVAPPSDQPPVSVSNLDAGRPAAARVSAQAATARRDAFGGGTAPTATEPTIGTGGVPVIPPTTQRTAALSTVATYPAAKRAKQAVKSVAKAPKPRSEPSHAAFDGSYTVAGGDTLYAIARHHGVSVAALSAANGISGSALRIGQRLRIPGATSAPAVPTPPKTVARAEVKASPVVTASVEPITKTARPQRAEPVRAAPKTQAQTTKGSFRWPVRGKVIAGFGQRTATGRNDGIDIAVPVGTPVRAVADGKVLYSGSEIEGFGKLILVRHANSWVSAYANSSSNLVKRGDKVQAGQTIAKSGNSGDAAQPQLHFELRRNSQPVDPTKHLM